MNTLVIGLRAVHFTAVLLLFGTLAFVVLVARPAFADTKESRPNGCRGVFPLLHRLSGWSLAIAMASGVLWFVVQAAAMSGLPLADAVNRDTLATVLGATSFGRVSEIRLGIALALSATLIPGRGRFDEQGSTGLSVGGGLLAAALLASIAWSGHGAAEQGIDRTAHLAADVAHLLAAGAWLGGLPALLLLLSRARLAAHSESLRLAAQAIRRFSVVGVTSVGLLVLTGAANSWYTVASVPALLGTRYGALLLIKLALFGAMFALAAFNRLNLTPPIVESASASLSEGNPPPALLWLRRTATAEFLLGLAIVAIVGALGDAIPARHEQPVWPLPYTLDWDLIKESAAVRRIVLLAGAGAFLGLLFALMGAWMRRRSVLILGMVGAIGSLSFAAGKLLVPAYPTTYSTSPVPYDVNSIARGGVLYARHCMACHGAQGHGDGPAAASLPTKPANFSEHAFHHREGDLLWWVKRGIAGTPMPAFGDRMSDAQIWDVIEFLRAQVQSDAGTIMGPKVDPWRPIVAPDFTFQAGQRAQETLKQLRSRAVVLLVLYSRAESRHRLQELTAARPLLDSAGVRIVAMPIDSPATTSQDENLDGVDGTMLALPDPNVVTAYRLFARSTSRGDAPPPVHVEFLIDRQGYLRARWQPGMEQGWDQISELIRQIDALNHEAPHVPVSEAHPH